MLKRLVMFTLLVASLASAKSYSFSLAESTKAGTAVLKPGQYTLKIDEEKVMLVDSNGRPIWTVAKLQEVEKKFETTVVVSSKKDGVVLIDSISLGGTNSKVVFQ